MAETAPGRLFATTDPKRFFSIPAGVTPPTGPLVLRSPTGGRLDVDPDAVAAWELSDDDAKRQITEEATAFARKATDIFSAIAASMRAAGAPGAPAPDPADPQAVTAGLKAVFDGIAQTTKLALSDDPSARAAAKQRMQDLAATIAEKTGAELPLADLPEQLREALGDPAPRPSPTNEPG